MTTEASSCFLTVSMQPMYTEYCVQLVVVQLDSKSALLRIMQSHVFMVESAIHLSIHSTQFALTTLAEEIVSDAINGEACFWIPGLAQWLTDRFWQRGGNNFNASTYGSLRWLKSDPSGSQTILSIIDLPKTNPIKIEALPPQTVEFYNSIGLQFHSGSPTPEDIKLFKDAFVTINLAPGLFESVLALVRSVHLLEASGHGYDTSYSDPKLPCSIFVSVPTDKRHAELRLAESIVHEAMHLQLTMLENEMSLVDDIYSTGYSPWQGADRPVSGLLHGLYVFCVIYQWLEKVRNGVVSGEDVNEYINRRHNEIAKEIAMVTQLQNSPALTEFGRKLVFWLYQYNR